MAYIGRTPIIGNYQVLDAIVATTTDTYALTKDAVAVFPQTPSNCIVSLNGVIQAPVSSYTISGSNIVFASALTGTDSIDFITVLGDVLSIGTPTDGTVTTAKLADSSVTLAKLTATGTKDATTFLRGDNTFASPSSDYVKLATASASGASYISFDGYFTSDYRNYIVFYNNLFSNGAASTAYIKIRQSNADKSDSNYRFVTNFATRTSGANNWYTNQGGWDVDTGARITADTLGDSEAEAGQLMLNIFNPLSTASDTRLIGDLIYMRATDAELIRSQIQMEYNNAGACSGITLYVDSGNISSTWTLYGIKS